MPDGRDVEQVKKALADCGVICGGAVYEVPCHLQPVFADVPYDTSELKITEAWCPRHICPPITSGTSPQDAERIADTLTAVLA